MRGPDSEYAKLAFRFTQVSSPESFRESPVDVHKHAARFVYAPMVRPQATQCDC
jgi:hypothetical protein